MTDIRSDYLEFWRQHLDTLDADALCSLLDFALNDNDSMECAFLMSMLLAFSTKIAHPKALDDYKKVIHNVSTWWHNVNSLSVCKLCNEPLYGRYLDNQRIDSRKDGLNNQHIRMHKSEFLSIVAGIIKGRGDVKPGDKGTNI
jgi:hypothetical protein